MQMIKRKISQAQYEMLLRMSPQQVDEYIEDIACHSGYHPAGYGFYGADFYCDGDGYSVTWYCGDSCD